MADRHSVVHLLRPTSEQLQEHVISLATYLPRRDFDVTVVGELDRAVQDALSRNAVRWVAAELTPHGSSRAHISRLRRLLTSLRASVVHIHGYEAAWPAARAVAGMNSQPALVYTAHELSGYESGALSLPWAARRRYRRLLSLMDTIITFSQRDRQALATLAPQAAAVAEVIPPGVDTRRIRHLNNPGAKRRRLGLMLDSAVVGVVAGLEGHAGLDTFLRAAAAVSEELPNVEFAIVGEGPLRPQLEDLAHELGITGATAFLGRRWDLPEVLATFNVVVVTTEAGGGVQTALQALSLDIPVVATDTGGLREVLGELEHVPLVPPGDVPALAAAIRQQLEIVGTGPDRSGGILTAADLFLTEKDMLVSTEAFDLDRPGAAPYERRPPPRTAGAELARRYGVGPMVRQTSAVYRRLVEERDE